MKFIHTAKLCGELPCKAGFGGSAAIPGSNRRSRLASSMAEMMGQSSRSAKAAMNEVNQRWGRGTLRTAILKTEVLKTQKPINSVKL